MSKRVRGNVRAHRRPGARPSSERSANRRRNQPGPARARESQLEIAEVVAEEIVEGQPQQARAELERTARTAQLRTHHKIKAGSLLATRAATEYVYVSQDMRRILLVAGSLVGVLLVLWLLVVVLRVVPLPFY
jgi:hypothetical protein